MPSNGNCWILSRGLNSDALRWVRLFRKKLFALVDVSDRARVKEDRMPKGFQSFFKFTAAAVIAASGSLAFVSGVKAQEDDSTTIKKVAEPVFRVSKLAKIESESESQPSPTSTPKADAPSVTRDESPRSVDNPNAPRVAENTPTVIASPKAPHPLDRALGFAHEALNSMRSEVVDYTATMAKRERINGSIGETNFMNIKIRCPRTDAQGVKSPFSIYMKFRKPSDTTGREVIWVDGKYENKLVAHEGKGLIAMKTWHLDPMGVLALRGQRYPIYEAGLENLILKLIEKAERDRAAGPCIVNYREGLKINNRDCSMIELIHEEKKAPYEFHKAQVFVDTELNLPVRYVAYDWPKYEGGELELIEEYTYFNIKTNVGLTDQDFDIKNPSYNYRGN